MIESLLDRETFRRQTRKSWKQNSSYWLSCPLRHVTDVGDYIVNKVINICNGKKNKKPTIVDMGFGNAWLCQALKKQAFSCNYVGIDSNEMFIEYALKKFYGDKSCRFELADLEEPLHIGVKADLVVYAFTLFELTELRQPLINAYNLLRPDGNLLISTIDSTYLILAVSNSWSDFLENLARYEKLPGIKYDFQSIDLGDKASNTLEYPSVLYSRDDYLKEAETIGFKFRSYKEHIFTAKPIPKVYFHIELIKGDIDEYSTIK